MSYVTFKTAKALKESGFPQPKPSFGQVWYANFGAKYVVFQPLYGDPKFIGVDEVFTEDEGEFFAPIATDILPLIQNQLGPDSNVEFYCPLVSNGNFDAVTSKFVGQSANPAEAAAQLWLKLNPK